MHPVNEGYRQLVEVVDRLAERLSARYGGHTCCRAGCSHCCRHDLSVFPIEAARVGRFFAGLPGALRERIRSVAQGRPVSCPLLIDERCAVYEARPIICRTQGLPLLYEADDGRPEVDFCPLNFTAPGAVGELDDRHLVPLEALNLRLAALNRSWCREAGLDPIGSGARTKMSEIVLGQASRAAHA